MIKTLTTRLMLILGFSIILLFVLLVVNLNVYVNLSKQMTSLRAEQNKAEQPLESNDIW